MAAMYLMVDLDSAGDSWGPPKKDIPLVQLTKVGVAPP